MIGFVCASIGISISISICVGAGAGDRVIEPGLVLELFWPSAWRYQIIGV